MARNQLPVLASRRMEIMPEEVRYVARPGLGALPSGTLTILVFMAPQFFTIFVLLWAIWWPAPSTWGTWLFAAAWTGLIAVLAVAILTVLLRRNPGFALGVMRAPFIRLTVTDRRVVWTVPWTNEPLMEIGLARVRGGILGAVDRRGRGNAAMMLFPGDPAADIDGNIHFDRLPNVRGFVAALERME